MIYDATTARQLPNLPRCGVIYEFQHRNADGTDGRGLYSPSGDRSIVPSVERIAYAAKPLLDDPQDPCHLLVLDDESRVTNNLWSNTRHLNESDLERNRDHHMEQGRRARQAFPGQRIGMYGLATPGYAHAEGFKEKEVEAAASRLGYDRLDDGTFSPVGVVEYLDFIVLVGYCRTSDDDFAEWKRRLTTAVRFCRRWQRQTVVFVNPNYSTKHDKPCPWFAECLAWINDQPGVDAAVWSSKRLSDEAKEIIMEASR